MKSLQSGLRTVDVARRAGYSPQQIRNLEHEGALPAATRTPSGYRTYTEVHVRAALAYRALALAVGPVEAKRIMRAPDEQLLSLVDAAHARLHAERLGLQLAKRAAAQIASELVSDVRSSDAMSISELAGALGVRPSTLRHWESEGLIAPGRYQRARTYSPSDVRDARIVHQLRQAGYSVPQLRALMPQLRRGGRWEEVSEALAVREASLNARSRSLISAAAELDSLLVAAS